jgi:methylated-DNA-[protein]-cysteine S-methyltransferase
MSPVATRSLPLHYRYVPSPVGRIRLEGRGELLTGLYLADHVRCPPVDPSSEEDELSLPEAVRQLEEYFAGTRTDFDLPLELTGTRFQVAVWSALRDIPYGATASYGEIADVIGRPDAVRAVGAANGRNPISIIVPCHRVIGSDGSLTGYGWGVDRKSWLLEHERKGGGRLFDMTL